MKSPLNLPSSPESCLTALEASLFITEDSHSSLKRSPRYIRRHLAHCHSCQLAVSAAWKKLREDQNRARQMVGAPLLSVVSGVMPPVCFGDCDDRLQSIDKSQNGLSNELRPQIKEPLSSADLNYDEPFEPELTEFIDSAFADPDEKRLITGFIETGSNYAERQLHREIEAKRLVARWAADDIPLCEGASILVDGGSQCLFAWKAMAARIKAAQLSRLSVLTFNHAVLQSWYRNEDDVQRFVPNLILAANHFNASDDAFKGGDLKKLSSFRPSVILIGTNGIDVDSRRISLGFNCGDEEMEDKKLLFRLRAVMRVVLLTASKIGDPGGRAWDLFDLPDLDTNSPIYFVTNEPSAGSVYRDSLDRVLKNMSTEQMRAKLLEKHMNVHWVVVRDNGKFEFDVKEFATSS